MRAYNPPFYLGCLHMIISMILYSESRNFHLKLPLVVSLQRISQLVGLTESSQLSSAYLFPSVGEL